MAGSLPATLRTQGARFFVTLARTFYLQAIPAGSGPDDAKDSNPRSVPGLQLCCPYHRHDTIIGRYHVSFTLHRHMSEGRNRTADNAIISGWMIAAGITAMIPFFRALPLSYLTHPAGRIRTCKHGGPLCILCCQFHKHETFGYRCVSHFRHHRIRHLPVSVSSYPLYSCK